MKPWIASQLRRAGPSVPAPAVFQRPITAAKAGHLDVVVIEKEPVRRHHRLFRRVLWIPARHAAAVGGRDSMEARAPSCAMKPATLRRGRRRGLSSPPARRWSNSSSMETGRSSSPRSTPTTTPTPGGVDVGRSILAALRHPRARGPICLRPPLETITFIGMMFGRSNADLLAFPASRALADLVRLRRQAPDAAPGEPGLYRRGVMVTSGNALAGAPCESALDRAHSPPEPAPSNSCGARAASPARVAGPGRRRASRARKGVVLACGGFPNDLEVHCAPTHLQRRRVSRRCRRQRRRRHRAGRIRRPTPLAPSGCGCTDAGVARAAGQRALRRIPAPAGSLQTRASSA